jgi:hypothetical protein
VALSAAPLLIGLLALVGGGVAYAVPRRRFRLAGLIELGLGAALATARHLGAGSGMVVGAAALVLVAVFYAPVRRAAEPDVGEDRVGDSLGLSLRLLLVGFAATATVALVVNRPLGEGAAIDLNFTWYWCAAVGSLFLMGDRHPDAVALGGALLTGALCLAMVHLGPEVPLLALWAAPPLAMAVAARWAVAD